MKRTLHGLVVIAVVVGGGDPSAMALGMPIERVGDYWTPTRAESVGMAAVRIELVPARDPVRDVSMWSVDETIALFNRGAEEVELHIGIPNVWSAGESPSADWSADFWGEAYVNGVPVETAVVQVVPNPSHRGVEFRAARELTLRLPAQSTAYVRLLFALPAASTDAGESRLLYPFELGTLWDGEIEFGSIVVRWRDRVFSFRTNLPGYALYGDRAEWFLRQFGPTGALEIRYVPRLTVFRIVAESVGCPMPWEIVDRVADGQMDAVRELLAGYGTDQLRLCAELPATLRGSVSAARMAGLEELRLEQFADPDSGIEGPLFVPDPEYDSRQMTESEALYSRFLRQEIEARAAEGTH